MKATEVQADTPVDVLYALPETVLEAAIAWQVKILSGTATRDVYLACEQWRAAHPDNNRAWQALQQLDLQFTSVNAGNTSLAKQTLYQAQQHTRISRRQTVKMLLMGGALMPAALGGLHYYNTSQPQYMAATGKRSRYPLADGSVLTLNSRSAADVQQRGQEITVVVRRGDAHLDTRARLAQEKPVLVQANQWSMALASGEYLIHQRDQQIYVRAMDGDIRVTHPHRGSHTLMAGRDAWWLDETGVRPYTETFFDPSGWLNGALVARQMPLGLFLAELDRYRDGWLRCAPPLQQMPVSGVFQVADTDSVLRALEQTLPVRVKSFTAYLTSISPA